MKYKILAVLLFLSFCVTYGNERESLELKDPGKAVGRSMAWTLLPSLPLLACMVSDDVYTHVEVGCFILSLSGFVFGPSAGHFYAEDHTRGEKSIGLRLAIVGVGTAGSLTTFLFSTQEKDSREKTAISIAVASGICILGSAAYDIFTCPQSVEKHNQSIRNQGGLYFSPEIDIKNESYGLSLSYRF